jgi:pimeloyl-ACP methyl ester carboxylesterase
MDYVMQSAASFGPHSPAQWRLLSEHIVLPVGGKWKLHYDPRIGDATRAQVANPAGADLWPLWDLIRTPTLVLRGAESDLLEEPVARAMTERGPKARLITYPGVGHAPALLQPEQVADVLAFINQPRSST